MSSRQLEEIQGRELAEAVAAAIGISVDDLDQTEWELSSHESDDGILYGYNVEFGQGSDPDVLDCIPGLVNGTWVRIGPVL